MVAKLDTSGKTGAFATLSGKGSDVATGVAIDRAGNIYVAGRTTSPNFPLRNALFATPGPVVSGFIAKFSPDATQLLYSTYFPAPVTAVAVDADGNAYLTGTTNASGVPVTAGLPGSKTGYTPGNYGAFLTKISAAGDRVVYSTVISGGDKPCGCCSSCFTSPRGASSAGVAVDAAGNAYMVGTTDTTDLPVTAGVLQPSGIGAFVAKVNAAGTSLAYLTYLGNGKQVIQPYLAVATTASALAVDAAGNAYVVGATWDPHLPVSAGAYQAVFHGWSEIDNNAPLPATDAYAIKLNPMGTAVVWGSYLGGDAVDRASAATVDSAGNLWVAGTTRSTGFPNAQGWSTGGDFVVEFHANGTALTYSGRYPDGTASGTLALDSGGLLHVASATGIVSAVAPSPRPAMRPWMVANAASGIVGGQIVAGEVISIYGPHIGPFPATLAGVQVLINGIPAPLLYASDSQINAVVPLAVTSHARIQVINQGAAGLPFDAVVLPADPAVFLGAGGYAAAINEDGTINSAENPARPGSIVAIWATGISSASLDGLGDGQVASGPMPYGGCSIYAMGRQLYVAYAGAAPGLVAGITQINFQLPADAGGTVDVSLVSGGALTSAPIYVASTAKRRVTNPPQDAILPVGSGRTHFTGL